MLLRPTLVVPDDLFTTLGNWSVLVPQAGARASTLAQPTPLSAAALLGGARDLCGGLHYASPGERSIAPSPLKRVERFIELP